MDIKQAKLAQAIKGETSNIVTSDKYDLKFEAGMLHAKPRSSSAKHGPFIVFPANIAWLEIEEQEVVAESKAKAKK